MGDLIPLADYVAAREALADDRALTCAGCPRIGGCVTAGECLHWADEEPSPPLSLRLVDPPDIIA